MQTLTPGNPQELAAMLAEANAAGHAVLPQGGGTKQDWGNPPARADLLLSTARLNQIVDHAWADLTVTVEAGCTIATLQETLAQRGQRLAVDPLWPEQATIGGVLSTNDTGALRLYFGGLRDLILGATIALPDGTLAESGGRVVKNVAGYDLPKLLTGALGTLGVITRAVFRLHPLPLQSKTLTFEFPNLAAAQAFVLAVQSARLAHSAFQVRAHGNIEADILLDGTPAGIAAQELVIRALSQGAASKEPPPQVWTARQQLWTGDAAIAKISILPADLVAASQALPGASLVVQATGLGFAAVKDGSILPQSRAAIERMGGSLVILRQPPGARIEAWGNPGDALGLMCALKQQFDPKGTLNPGRYVGGI